LEQEKAEEQQRKAEEQQKKKAERAERKKKEKMDKNAEWEKNEIEKAPTREERAAKQQAKLEAARQSAEQCLQSWMKEQDKLNKLKPESTVCVFLDGSGSPLVYAESGEAYTMTPADRATLDQFNAKRTQESGYGGIQCAEPAAILKLNSANRANRDSKRNAVAVYSLAYDRKSKSYKAACGSCRNTLSKYDITDLHG
jgi:hypothetical protein